MRKLTLCILLIYVILQSCSVDYGPQLDVAFSLCDTNPDSANAILNSIDRIRLTDGQYALYGLTRTKAHDKLRRPIDDDSMIRRAYDWYCAHSTDRHYSQCMFYMGRYYATVDSTEQALKCLEDAYVSSALAKDTLYQCLALNQASVILRYYEPETASDYALKALSMYSKYSKSTEGNLAQYYLNFSEAYAYDDKHLYFCIGLASHALSMATELKNTDAIKAAYQDLSIYHRLNGDSRTSLDFAKKSYLATNTHDFNDIYVLCQALIEADSIPAAKRMIQAFSQEEYSKKGDLIFSLLRRIAVKENDLARIEEYIDSTDYHIYQLIASESKDKYQYYKQLISEEKERVATAGRQRITVIISLAIGAVMLLCIVSILIIYSLHKKRAKEKAEEQETVNRLKLQHKEAQIASMRNFLIRKIEVIQKFEDLKKSDQKKLILSDEDWEEIEVFLNNTQNNFVVRLKEEYPNLTEMDCQFLMLIRLELPASSLAAIYHIEEKSIKQRLYLLKKKLNIENPALSTRDFISKF